jgi:hypothetical protein
MQHSDHLVEIRYSLFIAWGVKKNTCGSGFISQKN